MKRQPGEQTNRAPDQQSENLGSSSALSQTSPNVTFHLYVSVSHMQNLNMKLLGLPSGTVGRSVYDAQQALCVLEGKLARRGALERAGLLPQSTEQVPDLLAD